MRRAFTLTVASIALLGAASAAHADFVDTFDTIDPAWGVDRYAPSDFSVLDMGGENVLNLGISSADSAANRPGSFSGSFYNTQGEQRLTGLSGTSATVSGDLYVSSLFAADSSTLVRSDLWERDTNTDENSAFYGIIGLINNDAADPFNVAAANRTLRLRVWDADTVGWEDLALPGGFTLDAWHNLSITTDGTSAIYKLDGTTVYTDTNTSMAGFETIKQAFVQAYNFGDSYAVQWDNVSAVPEPASLSLIGLGALSLLRRKRIA